MKKLLLSLALTLLLCSAAMADDFIPKGSAVVPGIRTFNYSAAVNDQSELSISNITNSPVTCKVTVFDHDGNDITSKCQIFSGSYTQNASTLITTGGGPFSIPAGSTRVASIWMGNYTGVVYGHAVIEWGSADDHLRKALIASFRTWGRGVTSDSGFACYASVNGGQPF